MRGQKQTRRFVIISDQKTTNIFPSVSDPVLWYSHVHRSHQGCPNIVLEVHQVNDQWVWTVILEQRGEVQINSGFNPQTHNKRTDGLDKTESQPKSSHQPVKPQKGGSFSLRGEGVPRPQGFSLSFKPVHHRRRRRNGVNSSILQIFFKI